MAAVPNHTVLPSSLAWSVHQFLQLFMITWNKFLSITLSRNSRYTATMMLQFLVYSAAMWLLLHDW